MALCAVKGCPEEEAARGTLTLEDLSTREQFECEIPICAGHGEAVLAGAFELVLDPDRIPRGITTGVLASGLDGDPRATPCRLDPNEAQRLADARGDGLCECGFPPGQHSFAAALAADAFERAYAERSGVTVEWLRAQGRVVVRCWCREPGCEGWASVSVEGAADYVPGGIYHRYHRTLSQVGARAEAFAVEFERKASRARHPLVRRWYERRARAARAIAAKEADAGAR